MNTLYEFFTQDFNLISIDNDLLFRDPINPVSDMEGLVVKSRILLEHNSSTRFFAFYVPKSQFTGKICQTLLLNLEQRIIEGNEIETVSGMMNDQQIGHHKTFYSNRIYLYLETKLLESELKDIQKISEEKGLFVTIRDKDYAESLSKLRNPLAFISHDSRDKDLIARPLASGLQSRLCAVWYDEYSLKVGDSLRESIEKGIKEVKKCILVITPNFLNNPGWGKKEFDSIFTREMIFDEKVVLPIWHNVSKEDIYDYSPSLANTFALIWPSQIAGDEDKYKSDVEVVISKIHAAINS